MSGFASGVMFGVLAVVFVELVAPPSTPLWRRTLAGLALMVLVLGAP